MNTSLLTGSRAYGQPTESSDVDLVILAEYSELQVMSKLSNPPAVWFQDGHVSMRFGGLNLIGVRSPSQFDAWVTGTAYLRSISPVTREQACEYFQSVGLTNQVSGEGA